MPAEITLPAFLEEKLRDAPHRHVVQKALENFGDWIRQSERTFFKDYTDHDIQHITQVLTTAANLIPESARPHFSGADAVALVLAVLFHDSALHLSEAGFHYLIKGSNTPYAPRPPFDTTDWPQTWADFMFLARRWDDAKILGVFGGDNGVPTAAVRDPFPHWDDLKRTDKLLVGEFIRQHHPRLAHEMALHGVPGVAGPLLKLDDSLPPEWRDLVGLIARSHGLPLRVCLDYLKDSPDFGEEARRDYQGIHAVYLMALLRVADYFQINSDRTSNRLFEYKKIYSGVSEIEHKAHQAVRNITNAGDPEALFIQAKPAEVAVFLRLKEWLAGIQQELDGSWAVLGEVYGRHSLEGWDKLGLAFRRVRSNLDDVAKFAKTVSYVPDRIRFDVARAELLKLLIGPLYGDDPSYGVRELMQNSIDAVREYDQFVLDNSEYAKVPRREQDADVVVELGPFDEAKGCAVMTISDRGIGMTEATIRDYFLRAGASYRQSMSWKSIFETDDIGAKSKVLRSGRFGIGALAAFLIGEEVTVETRHLSASDGYKFKAVIENEIFELQRDENLPVGTSIVVAVNLKRYNELIRVADKTTRPALFDWYRLSKPSISRRIGDTRVQYQIKNNVHEHFPNEMSGTEWRELISNQPYQVYWAYNNAPVLACNGFFVSNSEILKRISMKSHKHKLTKQSPFDLPNLLIQDPDGLFPLSLKRDGLRESEYPFELALTRDVLLELVAWVFFQGPSCLELPMKPTVRLYDSRDYFGASAIVMKHDSYAIRLATLLSDHPISHLVIHPKAEVHIRVNTDETSGTLVFADLLDTSNDIRMSMSVRSYKGKKQPTTSVMQVVYNQDFEDYSIDEVEEINSGGTTKRKNDLQVINQDGPWITAASKRSHTSRVEIISWPTKKYAGFISGNEEYIEYDEGLYLEEQYFPKGCYLKVDSAPWLLDEIWQEFFSTDWLPLSLEERMSKYPKAAKFFSEKYPQVAPDAVWQILGIQKPDGCVKLPLRDPNEPEEMALRAYVSNDIPF